MVCDLQLPGRARLDTPTAASLVIDLLPSADTLQLSTVAVKELQGGPTYRLGGSRLRERRPALMPSEPEAPD